MRRKIPDFFLEGHEYFLILTRLVKTPVLRSAESPMSGPVMCIEQREKEETAKQDAVEYWLRVMMAGSPAKL
jgi:hypothetical protein